MRAIWSGIISFGMVTVPVKMYGATEEKRVAFHQVHAADGGRVRQKRVCELDGEEVPLSDVAKGYELPDGDVVVLSDEDFQALPEAVAKTISVQAFVPEEQIDPIMYEKSYYLAPDKHGVHPYALLRDAMAATGRVAVVRFAMRERESLAALRVRDDVLTLETMLWADEVREPDFDVLDSKVEPKAAELKMAELLIDSLKTDFDPSEYHDSYREALEEVIEAKVTGREVVTPPAPAEGGAQVIDLMAALKASVDAAKKTRGGKAGGKAGEPAENEAEAESEDGAGHAKPAAKKAAAKKTAASKGTASKSTASKSAASKGTESKTAASKSTAAKKTAASASKSSTTPTRAAKGARGTAKATDLHKPARKKPATKSTSRRRGA